MKIDCFIMNPPYNSGDGGAGRKKNIKERNSRLCSNIMKSLENIKWFVYQTMLVWLQF